MNEKGNVKVNKAGSERAVEVPWVLDVLNTLKPKTLLDIGFAGGWYLQQIVDMGIQCTGLDSDTGRISGQTLLVDNKRKQEWVEISKSIVCMTKDITKYPKPNESFPTFSVVLCLSTIEHIVPCGYQNECDGNMEADLKAIANMKRLTSKGGSLILTFPCGQECFFYNRSHKKSKSFCYDMFVPGNYDLIVYGEKRVGRIVGDWTITEQKFWTRDNKNNNNEFISCDANEAFSKKCPIETPTQSVCCMVVTAPC